MIGIISRPISLWIGPPVAVTLLAVALLTCQKQVDPVPTQPLPTTSNAEVSDCKNLVAGGSLDDADAPPECLEWNLDGAGTLALTHVNAVFNCCIDSVTVTTTINGGVITIVEREYLEQGGCDCVCPYDIAYQLADVAAGQYTVRVYARYSDGGDPLLLFEFPIALNVQPNGSYCPE